MRRRRIARTLGAAAAGWLGVAFLPAAAAFADDYTVEPAGNETITGIYGPGFGGADTAPPAVAGSIEGYGPIDDTDTTTNATGAVTGDESRVTDGFADTNSEVLVTSDAVNGVTGTDAPPVGSVFDTYTFDEGVWANVYSAIPTGSGGYQISDTLASPIFGNFVVPMTFNAADVPAADASGVSLSDGDFVPQGTIDVNAINGIPPLTMAVEGMRTFQDSSADTSFGADVTTTTDVAGTYTEAVLVTSDPAGSTVGTAAGDVPGVGSVFNTMDLDGNAEVYSDIVTPSGQVITDTIETPLGNSAVSTTFDATKAEAPVSIDLPDGHDIVPVGTQVLTEINGLPPVDVGVQGTDTFDLDSGSTVLGTFAADETTTLDLFGDPTQTLLVTSGTQGLATGSVVEAVGLGPGFENIYSDVIDSSGAATITDTLVTPFGDFAIPDASAFALVLPNLTADTFSAI